MKNIFVLQFVIFAFVGCVARKKVSIADLNKNPNLGVNGTLIENKSLNKFEGKWAWSEGEKKFVVKFKIKHVKYQSGGVNAVFQVLTGDFEYLENRKKVYVDPNIHLAGTAILESDPVVFSIPNNSGIVQSNTNIELVYINSDTLEFRFEKGTPAEAKERIKLPVGIVLKRVD